MEDYMCCWALVYYHSHCKVGGGPAKIFTYRVTAEIVWEGGYLLASKYDKDQQEMSEKLELLCLLHISLLLTLNAGNLKNPWLGKGSKN